MSVRKILTLALSAVMLVTATAIALYAVPRSATGGEGLKEARKAYQRLVQQCQSGDSAMCELLPVADTAFDGDIEGAIAMAENLRLRDDNLRTRCHDVSHVVGKLSYDEYGILDVIAKLPAGCMGGVYHGALEQWGVFASGNEMLAIAGQVCEPLRQIGEVPLEVCTHGVGHALERNTGDWEQAARMCSESMPESDQSSCVIGATASGVDSFVLEQGRAHSMAEVEALVTSCTTLEDEVVSSCVEVAVFKSLPGAGRPRYVEGHRLCARFERVDQDCSHGLGMMVASAYQLVNPTLTVATCRRAAEHLLDACLAGAATWVAMNMDDAALAKSICTTPGHVMADRCREALEDIDRLTEGHRTLDKR